MEILELMKQRHSVRQYKKRPIESEKREILDKLIAEINNDNNLKIQIFYDEPKCFDSFMGHYGKFDGVENYIALVGDKNEKAVEKLGYFGEKIVLKAQELGLNTCWVALTHGKSKAVVKKGEKCACIISLGYGKTAGTPHKSKPIEDVCNYNASLPEWFISGIDAALLAPTAMNQQKFHFSLLPNGKIKAEPGNGFYTKLDLGIAKYHFDAITEKPIFKSEFE